MKNTRYRSILEQNKPTAGVGGHRLHWIAVCNGSKHNVKVGRDKEIIYLQ